MLLRSESLLASSTAPTLLTPAWLRSHSCTSIDLLRVLDRNVLSFMTGWGPESYDPSTSEFISSKKCPPLLDRAWPRYKDEIEGFDRRRLPSALL